MKDFNHIDENGNAIMVDVSLKKETEREAVASGTIVVSPKTMGRILEKDVKKGDVLSVAQLAGIMGAKKTSDFIPLCHPLALTSVKVELDCDPSSHAINITATCSVTGRTGVEMEALTAVTVAGLTVYDMCKAIDKEMKITNIRLLSKFGGRSGKYRAV